MGGQVLARGGWQGWRARQVAIERTQRRSLDCNLPRNDRAAGRDFSRRGWASAKCASITTIEIVEHCLSSATLELGNWSGVVRAPVCCLGIFVLFGLCYWLPASTMKSGPGREANPPSNSLPAREGGLKAIRPGNKPRVDPLMLSS